MQESEVPSTGRTVVVGSLPIDGTKSNPLKVLGGANLPTCLSRRQLRHALSTPAPITTRTAIESFYVKIVTALIRPDYFGMPFQQVGSIFLLKIVPGTSPGGRKF